MPKSLKTINLFSGVGGIELGFAQAGFDPIFGNEIDPYAASTYRENHGSPLLVDDVVNVNSNSILDTIRSSGFTATKDGILGQVLTAGFPCQPFSVAGLRKGFDDERGNVFWEILRLIDELKPTVVLLENVKNLKQHDEGRTFETIVSALRGEVSSPDGVTLGSPYKVKSAILNAKDFGIPQNRERVYMVAFKDQEAFNSFRFPEGEAPSSGSNWILRTDVDQKYFYTSKTPFFDELSSEVTKPGTFYQWRRKYVRSNKSDLCPTLTANMGMGGHNVPLIRSEGGIRKLTPMECFDLMGFPSIRLPNKLADSRLYKQAGNSVVVPVVTAIARQIKIALSGEGAQK
jgi:DNA (cytosine-5)-methyltransferase 1